MLGAYSHGNRYAAHNPDADQDLDASDLLPVWRFGVFSGYRRWLWW